MHVEVSTDRSVEGDAGLRQQVTEEVEGALARFSDQLTRVEVHLGDENGARGGTTDKRCAMEARPAGLPPVAVTHHAATVAEACRGAVRKLQRLLDTQLGRVESRAGRESIRRPGPG
jgi:hypothetical protein